VFDALPNSMLHQTADSNDCRLCHHYLHDDDGSDCAIYCHTNNLHNRCDRRYDHTSPIHLGPGLWIHRNKDLLFDCISHCMSILGYCKSNFMDNLLQYTSNVCRCHLRPPNEDCSKQHSCLECFANVESYYRRSLPYNSNHSGSS